MRSSGTTPVPPVSELPPLYVVVVGDDDPRLCTGRRLLRLGRARLPGASRGPAPLLLDPMARTPLSPSDRGLALAGGILAIDCSWNRLSAHGSFDGATLPRRPSGARRRLPWLLAGNPQHFGRLGELNTAEALGAALAVLGFEAGALDLLAPFAGGPAFLTINAGALARYAACDGPAAILDAEADGGALAANARVTEAPRRAGPRSAGARSRRR